MTGQFRRIPLRPLSGGLNQSRSPFLLGQGETPDCLNVDFDQESVKTVNGSVKFNNQTAPRSGIRTKVDPSLAPLSISDGKSVPLRGYGYIPYQSIMDIGGDFSSRDGGGAAPFNLDYHNARGRSFDLQIGFRLPEETLLYEANARGAGAGSDAVIDAAYGYDEALDEFIAIVQKGGDRLSPMSWALGIVNTGQAFEEQTGSSAIDRPTNYALCFIWYDAPCWGVANPNQMMYSLTDELDVESNGERCTMALRAFIVESFIEPGKDYRVSVQLERDSGSASWSGSAYQTSWNDDGVIRVHVQESFGSVTTHSYSAATDTADGIWAWKGPGSVAASSVSQTESLQYLTKYGIRYSGRDATFLGLGYRFAPWSDFGFIPFGTDSAPLENGGFSMLDCSSVSPQTAMPTYSLNALKAAATTYMIVNDGGGGMSDGYGPGSGAWPAPNALTESAWAGLGSGAVSFNANALEGYRATLRGTDTDVHGGVITMLDYSSQVGYGQLEVTPTGWDNGGFNDKMFIRAFRWNQRDVVLSDFRVYSSPRDMTDPRSAFALSHNLDLRDASEPDLDLIQAYYPLDDSGGGVLRDELGDNDGYLAPLGLGVSKNGRRGSQQVFLSGEGDALELNLSNNPIFMREFQNSLDSGTSGFAIEVTFRLPEASYAISDASNNATLAPWLFTWEVEDASEIGSSSKPQPILQFGHRCDSEATVGAEPFLWPMGFVARVPAGPDQADAGMTIPDGLHSWYRDTGVNYPRWSKTADWTGQSITVQVGVQPSTLPDTYDVYIAATPKGSLFPEDEILDDAEMAYFSSSFQILKRDIPRSVITIGGSRDVDGLGYLDMSARMIVDEVRVFGSPAPGALPGTSGGSLTDRSGKLGGVRSLPARALGMDDIRHELGESLELVNVTEGDTSVTTPARSSFYSEEPEDTVRSLKHLYLQVSGDTFYDLKEESLGEEIPEFYFIGDQSSGSVTLSTPYAGQTRSAAHAWAFRLVGYTAVADDLYGRALAGGGALDFDPSATGNIPVRTPELFYNLAPVSGNWGIRVFAPSESVDVLPDWVTGCMRSRLNPILALHPVGSKLYAATSGSLFEADDRWRHEDDDGWPEWSLEFRPGGEMLGGSRFPLASDHARFEPSGFTDIRNTILEPGKDWIFDAVVELNDIAGIQTIAWSGAIDKNVEEAPAVQWWIRLNDGRPEFCVGSTAQGATGPPPGQLFIATGREALPVGQRVHIRWQIENKDTMAELDEPILYINGRLVESGTSFGDSGATYWMRKSTMAKLVAVGDQAWQVGDGTGQTILGAAYAYLDVGQEIKSFQQGEIRGTIFPPNRHRGWMFNLNGRLSGFVVTREDQVDGFIRGKGFNPYAISYTNTQFEVLNSGSRDGIGHILIDEKSPLFPGTIYSHPLIGIWHQMGLTDEPVSFAQFGNEIFATNGGRVSVIRDGVGSFAGVLPPSSKPSFSIEKKPLWEPNSFEAGSGENDPIEQAAAGAAEQVLHYSTYGNNYMRQAHSSELDWEDGDYWCLKMLFRPRSVSGVQQIWGARDSSESGRFLLCDGGRLVLGWYDTYLKQNVSIRTSTPVLRSGYVHYIYIRKQWPQGDATFGNWSNSVFEESGAVNDAMIVRRFRKDSSGVYETSFDAVCDNATLNGISFTTDEIAPSWAVVSGPVSNSATTYSATGSTLTADSGSPFTADMIGMYWQFEDGVGLDGQIYRVIGSTSSTLTLSLADGSTPSLSVPAGTAGRVFSGVALVKSEGFDASTTPDTGAYDVEFMGTALQSNVLNAITPLSGEAWSFGWVVTDQDNPFLAAASDVTQNGTDSFIDEIDSSNPPGGLEFSSSGENNTVVDPRGTPGSEVSTQPNEALEVELDSTLKSVYAGVLTWNAISASALFTGTRRVRVSFYDPVRNIESNPSPELVILPSGEDKDNPSGEARYLLENLPRSVDGPHIHRRVYMSLSGAAELFRVADIPDNSSTSVSIVKSDYEIVQGPLLSFNNSAPPRCMVLGTSQSCMFYGAIKGQPDSYIYSLPFEPHRAPLTNFNQVNSGDGESITGMADLLGKMVIFKRSGIWPTTVKPGLAQQKSISADGAGCRSHASIVAMEDRLIFVGDRGPMIMKSTGRPMLLAPGLLKYFREEVDKSWLSRCSAAQNVGRSQYVLAIKDEAEAYPSRRFSLEYDVDFTSEETRAKLPSMHRASRYEDPNVTAMGSLDDRRGGSDRLVAGTREGFVVWMDVEGAHTAALMGYDDVHGTVLIGGNSDNIDQTLEGPLGVKLRWLVGVNENVEQVLGFDHSGADPVALVEGATATVTTDTRREFALGPLLCEWWTQVVDAGMPDMHKTWRFLDLTRSVGAGSMKAQVYGELDTDTPKQEFDIDLTVPFQSEALNGIYLRLIQMRFFTRSADAGQAFELLDMVFRPDDTDPL